VSGEVDLSKLRDGVYLIDEDVLEASGDSQDAHQNFQSYVKDTDYTKYVHVTLAIPASATITQITSSISAHKDFIKSRQSKANDAPLRRVRQRRKAERDNKIMELSKAGNKPNEVIAILGAEIEEPLTNYDVARIKRRKQK
jgi:thiamine pyrophosphate-dependent acetolactate synthase large subunit-like protein